MPLNAIVRDELLEHYLREVVRDCLMLCASYTLEEDTRSQAVGDDLECFAGIVGYCHLAAAEPKAREIKILLKAVEDSLLILNELLLAMVLFDNWNKLALHSIII